MNSVGRHASSKAKFSGDSFVDDGVESEIAASRGRILAEIEHLDLKTHIASLEIDGFTIVPPEEAWPGGFYRTVTDKLLEIAAADLGIGVPEMTGRYHSTIDSRHGQVQLVEPLLHRDPVFSQALMNPSALALVEYLLGESCVLFSSTGQLKGAGDTYLPLHADQANSGSPAPFPPHAQVCNAVLVLSDYGPENGATCFVPGSHKWLRHPSAQEARDLTLFRPVEAKAGSIIVWHGNTWHGAIPRRAPGLRLSVIQYFGRWFHNAGSRFVDLLPKDQLDGASPRFRRLVNADPTPGLTFRYGSRAARFSQWG